MKTKEELQERAQLIRALEASCSIQYPTAQEANFRIALMKHVAAEFQLTELRTASGPINPVTSKAAKGS